MFDITRTPVSTLFICFAFALSLLMYLQILEPFQLYFNKKLIVEEREWWRLFTSIFCFGSLSIQAVFSIITFVQFANQTEGSYFSRRPLDFLVLAGCGCIAAWCYALCTPTLFLGSFLSSYFFYYWTKKTPDGHVVLFFVQLRANWGPFAILAINATLGGFNSAEIRATLLAYLAAHVFFFLRDVVSVKWPVSLLVLPDSANHFVSNLFS